MHKRRLTSAGYTLMELIVVMALITMLFFVAGPRFMPRLLETRIETSARRLAAMTKYLHAQTVLTRRDATLHIDRVANEYWVTAPPVEEELEPEVEMALGGPEVEMDEVDLDAEHMIGSDGLVLGVEFDLDQLIEGDEVEEEEMTTAFISRTALLDGVRFTGLLMPNADPPDDTTEFEIKYGPFGLTEAAIIVMADERGRQLSVRLDPVLGESRVEVPDERVLDALNEGAGRGEVGWPGF